MAQWQEIYEQSSGKGRVGNAIGGFTFQWSDGWWKFGQDSRLNEHDTNASWSNAAYGDDYEKGENNMNEEWWGDRGRRGRPTPAGCISYIRALRSMACSVHTNCRRTARRPTLSAIRSHFATIDATEMVLKARGDRATMTGEGNSKVRVSGMRLDLATFSTGGTKIRTPAANAATEEFRPSFKGFDRMESYYADIEARPTETFTASLSLNVLGNVPTNPIDEIFYENRGRVRNVLTDDTPLRLQGIERLKVYRANMSWDDRNFRLDAFYRTGHYHWGYEGRLLRLVSRSELRSQHRHLQRRSAARHGVHGQAQAARPEAGVRPRAVVGCQSDGDGEVSPTGRELRYHRHLSGRHRAALRDGHE